MFTAELDGDKRGHVPERRAGGERRRARES